MKRRAAVVVLAALAAISLCLAPAYATGRHHRGHAKVLVVDNEHRHWSCLGTRDPFQTIQRAVDDEAAVPGATIWVCPGRYHENVKVETERLTFKGANAGRDPTGRRRGRESIVTGVFSDGLKGTVQLLADDITWDGFTIRGIPEADNAPGMYTDPAHSGYLIRDTVFQDNGVGLRLGASGEHPTLICRNRFQANNEFEPGGYGIFSDEGARDVAITWNRFQLHNEAGVFFADRAKVQQDVLIDHNKSVDDKTFAAIFNTARVKVSGNSVRARVDDLEFPEETSAIFIGARNDDVLVKRNRVRSASGDGIHVTPSPEPNRDLPPKAPTDVTVAKNKATGARLAGLHMAIDTAGVTVTANIAIDNGEWDCRDDSSGSGTASTANSWTDNLGVKSSPDGLCAPPPPPTDKPDDGKGHHHKQKHKMKDPCTCTRYHPRAV